MMREMLSFLACLMAANFCSAFQLSSSLFAKSHVRTIGRRHYTTVAATDKEKEIAELEAQLQKLRTETEENDTSVEKEGGEDDLLPPEMAEPSDSFDMNTYRKRVANIKEPPPAEFLTEAWKESMDDSPGLEGTLKTAGIVIAVLVLLVAFSQVPVGNEGLTKYSAKIGL